MDDDHDDDDADADNDNDKKEHKQKNDENIAPQLRVFVGPRFGSQCSIGSRVHPCVQLSVWMCDDSTPGPLRAKLCGQCTTTVPMAGRAGSPRTSHATSNCGGASGAHSRCAPRGQSQGSPTTCLNSSRCCRRTRSKRLALSYAHPVKLNPYVYRWVDATAALPHMNPLRVQKGSYAEQWSCVFKTTGRICQPL